jgi:hypothetical protein
MLVAAASVRVLTGRSGLAICDIDSVHRSISHVDHLRKVSLPIAFGFFVIS